MKVKDNPELNTMINDSLQRIDEMQEMLNDAIRQQKTAGSQQDDYAMAASVVRGRRRIR